MLMTVLAVAAVEAACGAPPAAGPSPVALAAGQPGPAASPRPVPAWIDPVLRGTLVTFDADGWPQRWDGGPFHHCFAASVVGEELATARAVAQRMTDLTGIPRTEDGPCNVAWESEKVAGHSTAYPGGTARSIFSAKIILRSVEPESESVILHEAGHVLGFGHSPKPDHLMNATPRVRDFSPEELAVLAWMYGR